MNERLEAALQYAARGWRVFQLNGYKKPFKGTHGHLDATTDPDTIEKWWRERPWANVGLATGDLVVFDADGPQGMVQFTALGLPRTLTAKTSKGFHFFYAAPGGLALRSSNQGRQNKDDDGLDIKAQKGYVVLPPSVNKKTGFKYRFVLDIPITDLPVHGIAYVQGRKKGRDVAQSVPLSSAPATDWGPVPAHLANLPGLRIEEIERQADMRAELPRFLYCLSLINAACAYDKWWETGAAIHNFDPETLGFEIFKRWSLTSPNDKHRSDILEGGICEKTWTEYKDSKPGQRLITKASVYAVGVEAEKTKAPETQSNSVNTTLAEPLAKVNGSHSELTIFAEIPKARRIEWVDFDKEGDPRATCANTGAAIRRLGVVCRRDVFHDKVLIGGQPVEQWSGDLNDHATLMLREIIKTRFGFDPGNEHARDAAIQEALHNSFDPVCDYLAGLAWDGRERLGTWLTDYLGAEDTALNREIGRLALMAAVRRARRPGSKFDQIIVLEGPEGQGKSSAIELLAGSENFSDQRILTLDERAQQEAMQGVWLYELSDLQGFAKAEIESVKAFASRTTDRARPAYGRMRTDRPRRCVFFATTNSETYLKSQTGNRRFWPVRTTMIRLEELARDRDQLWAEASTLEARANGLVLAPSLWSAAGALQDERRDHDPWEDMLAHVKGKIFPRPDGREGEIERVTSRDLFDLYLKLPADRQTDMAAKRLGYCFRRLGWDGPRVFKVDGVATRGYVRDKI